MNNAPAILRSLIIYVVCVPLAIFIGYLLTDPTQLMGRDTSAMAFVGILALIIVSPLLLRWHHPLVCLSWNSTMVIFFLPGQPGLWFIVTLLSLIFSVLHRTLGGVKQLVSVPQVTWSLLCLIAVVAFTAKMTGVGLHTFGSEVYGGKRYVLLVGAILGYFARVVVRTSDSAQACQSVHRIILLGRNDATHRRSLSVGAGTVEIYLFILPP